MNRDPALSSERAGFCNYGIFLVKLRYKTKTCLRPSVNSGLRQAGKNMRKFNFPGDIHFVTIRTFNNIPFFKAESCCKVFLEILDKLRVELKFEVLGYCIMLDHVHFLIQPRIISQPRVSPNSFGEGSQAPNEFGVTQKEDISYIFKRIKGATAREINKHLKRQGNFWKHRFYDFNIYTRKKFDEKLKYIHKNPIKHGLVEDISTYKYCSWRNYELNDQSIFRINYLEY